MEQGEVEKRIIEQCMREGHPLPDKIRNAPSLTVGLQWYWDAFMELTTCRPSAFSGMAYIPWTAMKDYAVSLELDEEESDDLIAIVHAMDVALIAHDAKKKKRSLSREERPSKTTVTEKGPIGARKKPNG